MHKIIFDCNNTMGIEGKDILAAVYITHHELFNENISNVVSTEKDLNNGYIRISNSCDNAYRVNIPTTIKDLNKFKKVIFEAWGDKKLNS